MNYMLNTLKGLLHQLEELAAYANDKEYYLAIGYLMVECAKLEEKIKELESEDK